MCQSRQELVVCNVNMSFHLAMDGMCCASLRCKHYLGICRWQISGQIRTIYFFCLTIVYCGRDSQMGRFFSLNSVMFQDCQMWKRSPSSVKKQTVVSIPKIQQIRNTNGSYQKHFILNILMHRTLQIRLTSVFLENNFKKAFFSV